MFEEILSIVLMLLLVIGVFVAAYFTSKFVGGRYQTSMTKGKQRIDIIERKTIGKDQYLLLVKVEGKTLLLGATPQNVNKLDELELLPLDEGEDTDSTQTLSTPKFSDIFKDMLKKNTDGNKKLK